MVLFAHLNLVLLEMVLAVFGMEIAQPLALVPALLHKTSVLNASMMLTAVVPPPHVTQLLKLALVVPVTTIVKLVSTATPINIVRLKSSMIPRTLELSWLPVSCHSFWPYFAPCSIKLKK